MVNNPAVDEVEEEQPQRSDEGIYDVYDDFRDADDMLNQGRIGEKIDQGVRDVKDNLFGRKKQPNASDNISDANGNNGGDLNKPSADAARQDGRDLIRPGADAAGQNGSALSQAGMDTVGNLGEGAKDAMNTGKEAASIGQKAADTSQALNTGVKVGQAAGSALEAGTASAEALGVAAAPETLGTSLAATAALEGAKDVAKVGTEGVKIAKEGVKLGERAEKMHKTLSVKDQANKIIEWIQKYWKCGCCFFIPAIVVIGVIYYVSTKIFHLDTLSEAGQAILSVFHRNTSSGNLNFTDTASQEAINSGDISESAIRVLNELSNKYKITVSYKNTSNITGKANQPYEFDIISANEIKCTLDGEKLPPISISLSPTFNWTSTIVAGKENARCAVGYYPGIDFPTADKYSYLGTGEFALQNIASSGLTAAKQESALIIDDVVSINSAAVNDKDKQDIPLKELIINSEFYSDISQAITQSLQSAYPDRSPSEIIKQIPGADGIHFEFD